MEELPINGSGSIHFLSHDKDYFINEHILNPKRGAAFTSGGLVNSMMERIEDITMNAKLFKYPL